MNVYHVISIFLGVLTFAIISHVLFARYAIARYEENNMYGSFLNIHLIILLFLIIPYSIFLIILCNAVNKNKSPVGTILIFIFYNTAVFFI